MTLRQFLERYGVSLGVLTALALVVVVLPSNIDERRVDTGFGDDFEAGLEGDWDGGDGTAVSGGGPGRAGGPGAGPGATGAGGRAGGGAAGGAGGGGGGGGQGQGAGDVAWGEGNCREDGRQAGVSIYMPPCVDWRGTDNGGATFRGVTADQILVVEWIGQIDPGTQAILQSAGLADAPQTVRRAYDRLRVYNNFHYQTYGREVVFHPYNASGPSDSDEAMRRDAITIADDIRPFAVLGGNPAAPIPITLARELAQRGVLCICTVSLTSEFYNELPPLLWSSLPTMNEYAMHAAEYIAKKLAGKNAVFAGDQFNPAQNFRNTERRFGLIYLEGASGRVEPESRRVRDVLRREFARYGIEFAAEVGYMYEPGRNQQDVTNLIATMRGAGVTTIVPVWDPLYPILITQEATRQLYFPEWFILGTGLSDTTTAGRLYDQQQWRHAFGISPLWVTWDQVQSSPGFREYHHVTPGARPGEEGILINIYRAGHQTLWRGIHMAGPNLTNETWVRGTLNYPPTGGLPASPLVYLTREHPTEIKDFVEVFYDHQAQGPDERGEQGRGMIMKTNNGQRYRLGEWPSGDPAAFRAEGAVAVTNDPAMGGDPPHEQDGHSHDLEQRCMSC